jgi:Na+/proline symporter
MGGRAVHPKVYWLFAFVGLYWIYCISMGIKSARMAKTASDYFIAGRKLGLWVFVLAATATSFSGWTFMGHPGLVYRDGFQYAYASFYAITIPFTGVMFLKRQWMLGKRFGYVTPGEMLADYFRGDFIRILVVVVTLFFSIPYLGVQLGASGFLFNVLTDGLVPQAFGMWVLSLIVLIYVATGGLRAVAYVDTVQCILLAGGIVALGLIALSFSGGWGGMMQGLANMQTVEPLKWGTTQGWGGGDYSPYFAVPGVIQFTAGLGVETPVGGVWTGIMCLTYMFALMGIQSAPAFSMWSFSNTNPRPFAPQQVWASSGGIGFILIFFTAMQGLGAHILGGDPNVAAAGFQVSDIIDAGVVTVNPDSLVPFYINAIADAAPWGVGLLAVCALAAMQSTGAAYMSTAGGILTRDLYKKYLNPNATHTTQKLFGRMGVAFIVLSALAVATFSTDALVLLGGLAVAYGFMMWTPLAAVCWFPWITRQGATWGLLAGILGVTFSEDFGIHMLQAIGLPIGWGRWPWTIHSAGWGMIFNLAVTLILSAMTQNAADRAHRQKYHDFLAEHATLPAEKRKLVPIAWIITLAWFFFAIGPGVVIGNWIFGEPNGTPGPIFGLPSIWAWQILWWALGVFMMWFLAYKMEMSRIPSREVQALVEDIGDAAVTGVKAGQLST